MPDASDESGASLSAAKNLLRHAKSQAVAELMSSKSAAMKLKRRRE
ncbi:MULTISPECIES: hypothetical protein [unclassified Herbaspirillum]|jgi:hypothetical protein|nr:MULTISPECIES: hypothetical protein [unclassified Herbaspirillum]